MNLTAGKGGLAFKPTRMFFDAYAAPPFDRPPDEVVGAEAINVNLQFGPLGTLTTGTLGLAEVPEAWRGMPWPRLVRLRLESEHGTGYIGAGIVEAGILNRGGLAGIPLAGVQSAYFDELASAGGVTARRAAIDGGALTPAGLRNFGVSMVSAFPGETRREAIERALSAFPNSEAGVSADLAGVIGRPEGATAATYTVDSRALDLKNLGWTATNYVTDAIWAPGSPFSPTEYRRADVPMFAPRRTAQASGDVVTRSSEIPGVFESDSAADNRWFELTSAGSLTWNWVLRIRNSLEGLERYRSARIWMDFEAEVFDSTIKFTPTIYRANAAPVQLPDTHHYASGIFRLGWDLDPSWLVPGTDVFPMSARIAVTTTQPSNPAPQYPNRFIARGVGVDVVYETPNTAAVVMPSGWTAPYAAGPTYEFTLPGVHVGPIRVDGLPGDVSQYAAGTTVTWHRGEASTRLRTAALPWPGQRR